MRRLGKEIIAIKLHDISKQYAQQSRPHDQKKTTIHILVGLFLANIFNQKNQIILDNTNANLSAEVKQIKDGVLLWKVCVILSLLFLLIEILLIRFWK